MQTEHASDVSWEAGMPAPRRRYRIAPSTAAFWRTARQAGKSLWQIVHGYVYARWCYGYIGSAIGERAALRRKRLLFGPFLLRALNPRRWGSEYHGKVVTTATASRLVRIKEAIATTLPEQVIPFESARDLILAHPDHIVALNCPCREAREHPCLPLDVCLIVGEPFASFVLEHHPDKARAITSEEAVRIIAEEAARGHVHHAFFKEAMLDRFYAICNCCSCCCGAITAQRQGTPMLISSGYVAEVDAERCQSCGTCVARCPFGAIALGGHAQIDLARCMGCGVCVPSCPEGALSLRREASKPAPLELPI